MKPNEILHSVYQRSQHEDGHLIEAQQLRVQSIVIAAESQKGVLAVLISSLTYKINFPQQDIRQHKVELPDGYSGRSYDTRYVTPFIREQFPFLAMKESGWLTRSIEQSHAFTLDFPGKVRDLQVKRAFLEILHDVQVEGVSPTEYLIAIFHQLRIHYPSREVVYSPVEQGISVAAIVTLLQHHFSHPYQTSGTARLPVLAIYAIYQLLLSSNARYRHKQLLPLKSHYAADRKSRSIGDIELINEDGSYFEAVEIKHQIAITAAIVEDVYQKIASLPLARYYILTTAEPNSSQPVEVEAVVSEIQESHGCEVIVNGIIPTLKYYLRLLENPADFITAYTARIQSDHDVKRAHRQHWQQLINNIRDEQSGN